MCQSKNYTGFKYFGERARFAHSLSNKALFKQPLFQCACQMLSQFFLLKKKQFLYKCLTRIVIVIVKNETKLKNERIFKENMYTQPHSDFQKPHTFLYLQIGKNTHELIEHFKLTSKKRKEVKLHIKMLRIDFFFFTKKINVDNQPANRSHNSKKYQVIIDVFCPVLFVFEVSTIS